MQSFDIVKTTPHIESFRVNKLIGMFDLADTHLTQHFQGSIELPESWNIGVIVGRSGTGKTTIAHQLFGLSQAGQYLERPIIDDMPQGKTVEEITKIFTEVGFSSPPSWLKPYSVLSNGEKMRVDLARMLLSDTNPIIFDEFTSVVDRDVAKVVSMVVSKNVRREQKQFIAVTCHYDVLDFLEPDWIFSTDTFLMEDIKKKRQPINISIHKATTQHWRMFRDYHYMSGDLNPGAHVFVAVMWGKIVGFIGIIHFPHPNVKNMKKVTRLVVLPDYQGIGIGKKLLNFAGEYYKNLNMRLTITTSHPALNRSMKDPWYLMRQGRVSSGTNATANLSLAKTNTSHRMTCSWEYKK